MTIRAILLVVMAVGLAGCAARSGEGGGLALPAEPVAVAPRAGAALPVSRRHSEVLVRAFIRDEEGRRREVGGADCVLEAPSYAASFRSPGRVVVPVPAAGAPALDVTCRAGALAGTARRGVVRGAPPRGWYPEPWYDPFWGSPWGSPWGPGWPGDPFYRRRSGVSVGLSVGDPGWGWGGPWPAGRGGAFYPDVEVELR